MSSTARTSRAPFKYAEMARQPMAPPLTLAFFYTVIPGLLAQFRHYSNGAPGVMAYVLIDVHAKRAKVRRHSADTARRIGPYSTIGVRTGA